MEVIICGLLICIDIGRRYNLMKKFVDFLFLDKLSLSFLIFVFVLGVCNDLILNISIEKKNYCMLV